VDVADESFFFKVMRGGFLLRRKTLANSLSAALPGIPKESIQQAIADMGLPAAVRGEQLTLEDFAALSAALGREADGD
jgi:16S rRNA (adenine1518-N6/adenine1519-N6)-dimethyltransferase